MRFTVCESTNPGIKSLLEQHFILWYCNVDDSDEWYPYAYNLGTITLPLISIISTVAQNDYLDRSTAVQYAGDFYARLKAHIGDMDHSVSITLSDVVLSLQVLTDSADQAMIFQDGDINSDNKIGLAETIYLLNEIAQQGESS